MASSLDHLPSSPLFPSWPFAVAHQDLLGILALLLVVVAGTVLLVGAVAFVLASFRFFYCLDRFFIGEVYGNPNPRTAGPVNPARAARIEAATLAMQRIARTPSLMPLVGEPPPASKSWAWLVPLSDLWYERCIETGGEKRRVVVTPQAREAFNAWVSATGTKRSDTHHVDRKALYEDYKYFAFEFLMGFQDEAATLLPARDFWPLVRERFGRDTTYGAAPRWCNRDRTVPVYSSTVPPKYDSTPSVLRQAADQAMAETAAAPMPAARTRKRL